jgi:cytochrome c-type biogenesis protein CcmH/NrfG
MLAVLEYRNGSCTAAVPHFEKAIKLLDSQLDALHAYATCLARLKRLDEAAAVLQKALALRPDDPQERHLLASVQIMGQKPKDALATLRPLLDAEPTAHTLQSLQRR